MKRALPFVFAALLLPGVAFAKGKPPVTGPGSHGKSAPKVVYVLKGTLSGYTAYDSSTSTNGSITIVVSHANYHGKALKTQTLTFPVGSKTRITLANGVSTVTDNDKGMVTVRAPKRIAAADLASTLQTYSARHVIDKGISS
ncbi:MAG: hypothetical protein ACRDLM_00360 [Gaiellaceae bacterium]